MMHEVTLIYDLICIPVAIATDSGTKSIFFQTKSYHWWSSLNSQNQSHWKTGMMIFLQAMQYEDILVASMYAAKFDVKVEE